MKRLIFLLFFIASTAAGETLCEQALIRNIHPELSLAVAEYAQAQAKLTQLESQGESRVLVSILQKEISRKESELTARIGKDKFDEILRLERKRLFGAASEETTQRNVQIQNEQVFFSNFKLAHTFDLENTWLRPIFLDIATSDGGNLIAWQSNQIALYNAGTGTKIRSFGSAHFEVESIAVSPDGKRVAAISGAELHVWSIENGFLLFSETLRSFGAVGWKDDKSLVVFDKSLREVQLVELETSSRSKLFSLPYADVTRFFFSDDRSRLGVVVQYETKPLMSQSITETDVVVFDTAGRTYGFLGVSSADGELRFSPDSTELWVEKEGMELSRGVFAIPPKPQSALRRRWGRHHFVEKRREDILIEMNIPAKAAGGLSYAIRYSQRMISLYINGSEAPVDKFFVGMTTDFFIDPTGRSVFSIQQGTGTDWKFQVDTRKVQ